MGKSSISCFRIMSCAGDSASKDDISPPPESKDSPDKCRWSFRKKSTNHHVFCKSLTSEAASIVSNKSNQEAIADAINSENASVPHEALDAVQTDDRLQLQSAIFISPELVADRYTAKVDYSTQEVVILLQASIRRYLARRQLEKIKNVVKLQAYCRGYLVRRQAAGTLRCLLSILKIQALVRAKSAVQSRKFSVKEKLHEEVIADLVKISEKSRSKTPAAIKNLDSNAFALQILEFAPKRKPICIRCDPSEMDSGWKWLERWMGLITSGQHKITSNQTNIGNNVSIDFDASEVKMKSEVTPYPMISSANLVQRELPVEAEAKGDLITNSSEKREHEVPTTFAKPCSSCLVQDGKQLPYVEGALTVEKDEQIMSTLVTESSDLVHYQILSSMNDVALSNLNANMDGLGESCNMPNPGAVNELHENLEMEGGHVLIGSRKSKNPTFAAVQAKFEGLSSTSNSNISYGHSAKDAIGESKSVTPWEDNKNEEVSKTKTVHFQLGKLKDVASTENFAIDNPVTQGPINDISDAGHCETDEELRIVDHANHCLESDNNSSLSFRGTKVEANDHLCKSNVVQAHGMSENGKTASISVNAAKSVKVEHQLAASNTSSIHATDSRKDPEVDKPSQEGSPRSLVTIPESHETPSSLASKHARTITKVESNNLARKDRIQSIVKGSPTNSKNDSGTPSSEEHSQKDIKNAKRRNSFGTAKTDHGDGLRSSSSCSLPSYMQPTESARAKINISISQKSSPDLNDRENHFKKRHSLPSEDGKQGSSPRIQRSTSQAQQNWKGNGVHSPNNSSERRWLR